MHLTKEQIEYKKELIALYKLLQAHNHRTGSYRNFYDHFSDFHPTSNNVNWQGLDELMSALGLEGKLPSQVLQEQQQPSRFNK